MTLIGAAPRFVRKTGIAFTPSHVRKYEATARFATSEAMNRRPPLGRANARAVDRIANPDELVAKEATGRNRRTDPTDPPARSRQLPQVGARRGQYHRRLR